MTSVRIDTLSAVDSPADVVLQRAEWQRVLFADRPRRTQLQSLRASWPLRRCVIRVHRNHGFELVASAMEPYLAYAGLDAQVTIGSYDDSLAFDTVASQPAADVELVWLDYTRYHGRISPDELAVFIGRRVSALRAYTNAPILVTSWGAVHAEFAAAAVAVNEALGAALAAVPGAHLCAQHHIANALGDGYEDLRAAAFTGSRLSDAANLATARMLGSQWIPGVILPPIKAVVLDLDGTCYAGVLGEDGASGVQLTADFRAFQETARTLGERGLFLAVVSRNEQPDVEQLFAERADFPLQRTALAAVHASWGHKADAIAEVASLLRIGTDAILFVDDNPGELAAVAESLPDVKLLHAGTDVACTARALDQYPGVWRWTRTREDSLRTADLAGSGARELLARDAASPREFLAALDVRLGFVVRPLAAHSRVYELSNKTNQFNLALSRWSEADVARRLHDATSSVVSVALADRLSDSGVICIVAGRRLDDVLVVDELCVSCRALGRHLEDTLIGRAVALIVRDTLPADGRPPARIEFAWARGPRNAPALDWLARFASTALHGDAGAVAIGWPAAECWTRDSDLPFSWIEQRTARAAPRDLPHPDA